MVESRVCFPSDLKLLSQSADKCLSLIARWFKEVPLQLNYWGTLLHRSSFQLSRVYRNKGKNYKKRLKESLKGHLKFCTHLYEKLFETLPLIKKNLKDSLKHVYDELLTFMDYFKKHRDLVERRILKGEKIPHEEKLFSIFETHTEWISKGKSNKKVELGHAVCITTNQDHFCLHWQVMEKESDVDMPDKIASFMKDNFEQTPINSWSFDRNFGSKENRENLQKKVECLVMPRKGKLSKKQKEKENQKEFKKHRRKHATVEANINQLECLGAGKCPDKGIQAFKRYVGLSVIAYNIHRIGRLSKNL